MELGKSDLTESLLGNREGDSRQSSFEVESNSRAALAEEDPPSADQGSQPRSHRWWEEPLPEDSPRVRAMSDDWFLSIPSSLQKEHMEDAILEGVNGQEEEAGEEFAASGSGHGSPFPPIGLGRRAETTDGGLQRQPPRLNDDDAARESARHLFDRKKRTTLTPLAGASLASGVETAPALALDAAASGNGMNNHVAAQSTRRLSWAGTDQQQQRQMQRHLSRRQAHHQPEDHWTYHAPPSMFRAHARRTSLIAHARDYQTSSSVNVSQEDAEKRGPSRGGRGDDETGWEWMDSEGYEDEEKDSSEPSFCEKWFGEDAVLGRILFWTLLPSNLVRQVSVPLLTEEDYNWWLVGLSPLFGTPLVLLVMYQSIGNGSAAISPLSAGSSKVVNPLTVSIVCGGVVSALSLWKLPRDTAPVRYTRGFFTFFGFLSSIAWIIVIANEVVSVLTALGLLISIPTSVLALTVLAWGNSLGDLVADVAVARAGEPKMAIGACFAGPLFNVVIGLGLSLTVGILKSENGYIDLQVRRATCANPSYVVCSQLTGRFSYLLEGGGDGVWQNVTGNAPMSNSQLGVTYACFGFLLASLVLSMIVVPLRKWRIRCVVCDRVCFLSAKCTVL